MAVPGQTTRLRKGVHHLDYVTPPVLYPVSLIGPDGYRQGKPSILQKLQVQVCRRDLPVCSPSSDAVGARGAGKAMPRLLPRLASQQTSSKAGAWLHVSLCAACPAPADHPYSVRCSCGFFFLISHLESSNKQFLFFKENLMSKMSKKNSLFPMLYSFSFKF